MSIQKCSLARTSLSPTQKSPMGMERAGLIGDMGRGSPRSYLGPIAEMWTFPENKYI